MGMGDSQASALYSFGKFAASQPPPRALVKSTLESMRRRRPPRPGAPTGIAADLGQRSLYPLYHVERRSAAVFQYGDQHAALAVLADDVGLGRETVANVGNVANVDRRVADHLHRQVVELLHLLRTGVQVDVVFELIDLDRSRWQHQVLYG